LVALHTDAGARPTGYSNIEIGNSGSVCPPSTMIV
jgi:hypothetical protein